MKICILTNGTIINYEFYKDKIKNYDFIICVDGGLDHGYKLNIMPDLIIGDFDSVSTKTLEFYKDKKCEILKYPKEKDYTDTEIAVKYAINKEPSRIDVLAGIGSRFDHSLANVHLLKQILLSNIKGCIISENNTIILIDSNIEIKGNIGDGISLLPFTSKVDNIYTSGLAYEVYNGSFDIGYPYGVSNYMVDTKASIKIKNGLLLIIRYKD